MKTFHTIAIIALFLDLKLRLAKAPVGEMESSSSTNNSDPSHHTQGGITEVI